MGKYFGTRRFSWRGKCGFDSRARIIKWDDFLGWYYGQRTQSTGCDRKRYKAKQLHV